MAYMSQEKKQTLAPAIKAILKKYGMKGSLSVHNHSGLTLTLPEGKIDFASERAPELDYLKEYPSFAGYSQVNTYWFHEHYRGTALKFLSEVIAAMNVGNHDNSDIMTDYFDVGWYVHVNVGKWNKPYVLTK